MYYCVWFFISFVVYTSNLEAWNCCKLPKDFWLMNVKSDCLWSDMTSTERVSVIALPIKQEFWRHIYNSSTMQWLFMWWKRMGIFFSRSESDPVLHIWCRTIWTQNGIANGSWLISHSTYKFIPFFIDTIPCFENISVMNLEI